MSVVEPAIHQRTDVVAAVAMDIDEARLWEQAVEIRHAHDIDARLVQDPSQTQPLEEITLRRIAMFRERHLRSRRLRLPAVVPGPPEAVPELGDLVPEGQQAR